MLWVVQFDTEIKMYSVATFHWKKPTFGCVVELVPLFWRLGFTLVTLVFDSFFAALEAVDDEAPEDVDDEGTDFIFSISANKAGARVLTTASRSDCLDRDWTAARINTNKYWGLQTWKKGLLSRIAQNEENNIFKDFIFFFWFYQDWCRCINS